MSVAAVVLAAGSSERMGRPKALLPYRGSTFLQVILSTIREAAVDRAVVAIAPNDTNILKISALSRFETVVNAADRSAGPIASIASAVRLLINFPVDGLLVWPVDIPHVSLPTISILLRTFDKHRKSIVIPTLKERRGHPVIFPRSLFGELLSVPQGSGANLVVRRDPKRVVEVPVQDPAITEDIDTPEDYERLISSTKSLL